MTSQKDDKGSGMPYRGKSLRLLLTIIRKPWAIKQNRLTSCPKLVKVYTTQLHT
jgi:hypothetical protein